MAPVEILQKASKRSYQKIQIGYVQDDSSTPTRDLTCGLVVPRATQSYTGNVVTNLAQDIGTTTNIIQVTDATNIAENVYININNESIYVDRKEGNTLFTKRGQDGTITGSHVRGTAVNVITDADDALIEIGDDFGFDGAVS